MARCRAAATVERVRAKWLVGCDGAHSIVRELLQFPMEGKEYPEHLVLADVHLNGELPHGILWLNETPPPNQSSRSGFPTSSCTIGWSRNTEKGTGFLPVMPRISIARLAVRA